MSKTRNQIKRRRAIIARLLLIQFAFAAVGLYIIFAR